MSGILVELKFCKWSGKESFNSIAKHESHLAISFAGGSGVDALLLLGTLYLCYELCRDDLHSNYFLSFKLFSLFLFFFYSKL